MILLRCKVDFIAVAWSSPDPSGIDSRGRNEEIIQLTDDAHHATATMVQTENTREETRERDGEAWNCIEVCIFVALV